MRMELIMRFDYGSVVPWVRANERRAHCHRRADMLRLCTPVDLRGEDFKTVAEFTVSAGQRLPFVLTWYP